MIAILICMAALGAEPLPDKVREFFERSEIAQAKKLKDLAAKLGQVEAEIDSETNGERRAAARKRRTELSVQLEEIQRTKPLASLGPRPALGELGVLPKVKLVVPPDPDRAVLRDVERGNIAGREGGGYILTKIDDAMVKRVFNEKAIPDVWRVVESSAAIDAMARKHGLLKFTVLEQVKRADLEAYRAIYEGENGVPTPKPEVIQLTLDRVEEALQAVKMTLFDEPVKSENDIVIREYRGIDHKISKAAVIVETKGKAVLNVVMSSENTEREELARLSKTFRAVAVGTLAEEDVPRAEAWYLVRVEMILAEFKAREGVAEQDIPEFVTTSRFGGISVTSRSLWNAKTVSFRFEPTKLPQN